MAIKNLTPTAELKREAKQRGIRWNDVVECKNDIERDWKLQSGYDHEMEIRKVAWHAYVGHDTPSAAFYRHGFARRFRRQLAKGRDYTCVRGYDAIAQQVAAEFPEFTNVDDTCEGTARLFDLLFAPNTVIPTAELYSEAFDMVAHGEFHDEPFGDDILGEF